LFSDDIELVPARQGERTRGKADTTKARSIGFEPKRSLADYAERVRQEREG
jgi:UDP-glucose 4-epimerase